MTQKLRIELNHKVAGGLLKQGSEAMIKEEVDALAALAGPGFEGSVVLGRTRAHGVVIAATPEARLAEAKDRALTRALAQRKRG